MTRVAFYHVGESEVATNVFIRKLGFELIKLPKVNKDTVTKGITYSPEFACFPFKVSVGLLLQAIEKDVEIFIMPGATSVSACQLSEFGTAQKYILKRTHKHCDIILIDNLNPRKLLKEFQKYNPKITLRLLTEALLLGGIKQILIEYIESLYREIYLLCKKRKAEQFKTRWLRQLDNTDSLIELYKLKNMIKENRDTYPILNIDKILRIAIIGDIHSINESFINNNIFERLCDFNVYSEQTIPVSYLFGTVPKLSAVDMMLEDEAEKYLKHNIGAYAKHTIKSAIKYGQMRYDGIIHIYPFNCMPESVVRNILPKVSKDYNIPILYLPIDEQTGDAGFTTRIEAFVDLIKIRKNKDNFAK